MNEPVSNLPEYSVSDLSGALKRTIEDAFGFVRLRGEISGYRGPHSSGHAYFSLKDANARIEAVIWRGVFGKLRFRPEEGLEVIATGRITTFPGKSSYQIVIEQMEPAGAGALMALLEERRRLLMAEGLFASERKKRLPYLPEVIGIVTSPTGAVIRDMIHRLSDRFPRRVILWPARVQGEGSAEEVAAAIRGFNAPDWPFARPDVLIVARGGGSLEDLWSFNEEIVVRAAAASAIPLISAIGHETDWTLLDLVADVRAPTPTAAAELAVPVRADLMAAVVDRHARLAAGVLRLQERRKREFVALVRALPAGDALIETPRQRLDLAGVKIANALSRSISSRGLKLAALARRLQSQAPAARLASMRERLRGLGGRLPLLGAEVARRKRERIGQLAQRLRQGFAVSLQMAHRDAGRRRDQLDGLSKRMLRAMAQRQERLVTRLTRSGQLLGALGYKQVLARGFAVLRDAGNQPVRSVQAVVSGMALSVELADGRIGVEARDGVARSPSPVPEHGTRSTKRDRQGAGGEGSGGQGSLF